MQHPVLSLLPFLLLFLLGAVASCSRVAAAKNPLAAKQAEVDRIIDEALARGQSYDMLVSLCTTAPHRLAGSAGSDAALEWARKKMLELGLENVRLEPVEVGYWERGAAEHLTITAPEKLAGRTLPVLALGGSIATPDGGIEAEIIAVSSFEELAALGDRAAGKIVLFNRPLDDTMRRTFPAYGGAVNQRTQGAIEAGKAGALASICRSMTARRDDVPHTGMMRYEEGVTKVPAAAVSTNGADLLAAALAEGSEVRVRLEQHCASLGRRESANVIGELRGTEFPDEILVVGGHLDGWDVGEGAHDDAAGCVQSLEAVRLLSELGLRPRRTIRVVLFTNEEFGMDGATAYYEQHQDEMDRHVMALESDRGAFTPRGFTTDAVPEARAILETALALLADTGARELTRGGGGPDIGPMAASGVPLVGYVPDDARYFDFHHAASDLVSAVHPRELALGAGAIAALVWYVADLEEPLPRE